MAPISQCDFFVLVGAFLSKFSVTLTHEEPHTGLPRSSNFSQTLPGMLLLICARLECTVAVIDGPASRTVTFFRGRRGVFEHIFRYSDPCGVTHRSPQTVKLL